RAGGPERQREIEARQEAILRHLDLDRGAFLLLRELRELGARRVRALEQRAERPASVLRLELGRDAQAELAGRDLHADGAAQRDRAVEDAELTAEHLLLARRDDLLHRRDLGPRDLATL